MPNFKNYAFYVNITISDDCIFAALNVDCMNTKTDILNNKKIVVVDDDQFSVLLTKLKLKKYAGDDNVIAFKEVDGAIEFLDDQIKAKADDIPDVILLETMMEDGKGWDFILQFEEIVKHTNHPIRLIILTSSQFFSDFKRSTQYDRVSGFLIKPLQIDQFIRLFSDEEVESSTLLLNSFIA
jgi:response regulator RpfG family c-di-GMP phosphodiesterase